MNQRVSHQGDNIILDADVHNNKSLTYIAQK